jgi:hypothetical protein
MGVPTANLDPAVLETELASMHRGVYFGFARLPDDPAHSVGRCRLLVSKLVLKALMVSALEATI